MSFLHAVQNLGKLNTSSGQEDYHSFLQLPLPLPADTNDAKGKVPNYVIRVGLKVEDIAANTLNILSVGTIDRITYPGGIPKEQVTEFYLYRKPVSSNTSWSFSPLYKLGKGVAEGEKELLGSGWQSDKNSRFYKLHRSVLRSFEEDGVLVAGNIDLIMSALEERITELAEYWQEKKSSYLLLLGVEDEDGIFHFPGEITSFLNYFKAKISASLGDSTEKKGNAQCSLCFKAKIQPVTLDKIFAFSTFDKENFLPGIKNQNNSKEKVFPICSTCYKELFAGQEKMENDFRDNSVVPGYSLYVIPELIGTDLNLTRASNQLKDFFKTGINVEERLFSRLMHQQESLVIHFLFAEKNQAQQRIHYLVEDVPPSRLLKLQNLWQETCVQMNDNTERDRTDSEPEQLNLDIAFRRIYGVLLSLAGKTDQEQKVMREKVLQIIARLLNNNLIETKSLKALMVSRLPGLLSDPDWVQPKNKKEMTGRTKLKRMHEILDFIWRINNSRRRNYEV